MRNILFSKSIMVGAAIALLALSSCSKKSSSASTITLTLPDFSATQSVSRAEKNQLSALSYTTKSYVSRVMLNVRGADIPVPIFYVAQSHDSNKPIPSSIQMSVPTGSNRLIQALLIVKTVVLSSSGDELSESDEKFYYGDVVKSLSGDDSVDVDLTSVATTPGAEGAIAGRLMDAVTSNGPTGRVNVQFAPPNGSPAMTVMQTEIHGGWFNFMAFEGLPFRYVMADGRVLVPDLNVAVQPASLGTEAAYIVVPPYYKVFKDNSSEVARVQKQGHKYLIGYFGSGAPNTNKLCYDTSGSLTVNDAYTSATPGDSTMVHWAGVGAPTSLLAGVKSGGVSGSGGTCGGINYLNEMRINVSELASHDRFVDFIGPFRTFNGNDSSKKLLDVYIDGTHVNVAWAFLPGVVGPARVTSVGVFTRKLSAAPGSNHGDPDYMIDGNIQCDRLTDPGFLSEPFTFQTAIQATAAPVNSVDLGAIATASEISSRQFQVVACPLNDFGLHKFTSGLGSASMDGGNNSNPVATQILTKAADDTVTSVGTPKLAKNNMCFPVYVQSADGSSNPAWLSASQTLSIMPSDSNVEVHFKSDCSDSLTGPFTIPGFNGNAVVYLKSAAASAYSVTFSAPTVTAGVYHGAPGTPSAPYRLVSSMPANLYANSCELVRFTAVGNGVLTDTSSLSFPSFNFNLGGQAIHYYQENDGQCNGSIIDASGFQVANSSTAYARIKFYGSGSDGTAVTLTPSLGSGTFGGGTFDTLTTTLRQPGAPAAVQIMLGNQASLELCQPFTAQLVDSQGHPTANTTGSPISLSLASTDPSAIFKTVSGSSCMSPTGSPGLTIAAGSFNSSGAIGYLPMTLGPQTINLSVASGQTLQVFGRAISVGPAIANHLALALPGETMTPGTGITGTPSVVLQSAPMVLTAYALTPSNNIDTNFNGALSLFTSGGSYTTNLQDTHFSSGVAHITITNNVSTGSIQAQVQSNPMPAANSHSYFVEAKPPGTPQLRIFAMNMWMAQGRCEAVLVTFAHATQNVGGNYIAASVPSVATALIPDTSDPSLTYYDDPTCSHGATTNIPIPAGTRAKLIGVMFSSTATKNISLSAASYMSGSLGISSGSINIPQIVGSPVFAAVLDYDASSTWISNTYLGACEAFAIGLHDNYGTTVGTGTVPVYVNSSVYDFYADSNCNGPVSSNYSIPTGSPAILIYGRAKAVGTSPAAFLSGTGLSNYGFSGHSFMQVF